MFLLGDVVHKRERRFTIERFDSNFSTHSFNSFNIF
jgi:hypothetical protein